MSKRKTVITINFYCESNQCKEHLSIPFVTTWTEVEKLVQDNGWRIISTFGRIVRTFCPKHH